MHRITRAWQTALAVVFVVAAAACVEPMTPARTFDDYEHKAKDTAESALSSVQTARLAARVGGRGDAFGPYVSVVLSESETGTAHASSVFASVQPPDDHADRLRSQLTRLLSRAEGGLARLRIAARRGELDRLPHLAAPLGPLSRRLERFIARHE